MLILVKDKGLTFDGWDFLAQMLWTLRSPRIMQYPEWMSIAMREWVIATGSDGISIVVISIIDDNASLQRFREQARLDWYFMPQSSRGTSNTSIFNPACLCLLEGDYIVPLSQSHRIRSFFLFDSGFLLETLIWNRNIYSLSFRECIGYMAIFRCLIFLKAKVLPFSKPKLCLYC